MGTLLKLWALFLKFQSGRREICSLPQRCFCQRSFGSEDVRACFYKRKWLGPFFTLLIKRICQKMFPPNRSATNISVFKLLIFKVSHVLEDAVKAVCDYFPCRAALHTLPAPLSHPCSYILSTPQRFFSSSSSAHRLIHNLQGQFMRTHMFQPGALSRNAPQHVEKDTVPTSRLQIDYFDELLAAIFSKPCI